MVTFADRLLEAMDARGIDRRELCARTGLKSANITDYISHPERSPRLSSAFLIADALDVSIDWLAGRDGFSMDGNDFGRGCPECPDGDSKRVCNRYAALPRQGRESVKDMCAIQELKYRVR